MTKIPSPISTPVVNREVIRNALMYLAFLCLYWAFSGLLIWWSYDITLKLSGGFYSRRQGESLVLVLSLLNTAVAGLAWHFTSRPDGGTAPVRFIWRGIWRTWIGLLIYLAAVLVSMQFGNPPLDEAPPILGTVNAQFFSEAGWMQFLVDVIPISGVASGFLCYLYSKVLEFGKAV